VPYEQCAGTIKKNRILVQDRVYDAFTKRFAETAGAMKVADGFEPDAVIGPLIDMKAVEKVEAHIARENRRRKEHPASLRGAQRRSNLGRFGLAGSGLLRFARNDTWELGQTHIVITKEEAFGLTNNVVDTSVAPYAA